jgi:hypothetical protein
MTRDRDGALFGPWRRDQIVGFQESGALVTRGPQKGTQRRRSRLSGELSGKLSIRAASC